jgi:pimeloyl-ACP methyl ester carboxylesterase
VVLEPGGGALAAEMSWIASGVAGDARVCVYDRPGRGWSDDAARPQDGAQIAAELHALLRRAHVPGPYVLAGHSFGGLYVMSYAAQYPQDVAGLVLIDSTDPTTTPVSGGPASSHSLVHRLSALVASTARLGVGRLIGRFSYGTLPPGPRDEARASSATAGFLGSFVDEFGVASRSTSQAGELGDLGSRPLVVLTAGRRNAAGHMEAQDKLAGLSSNSLHRVVRGATHQALVADPEDAKVVSRAILDVVESARSAAPLADGGGGDPGRRQTPRSWPASSSAGSRPALAR